MATIHRERVSVLVAVPRLIDSLKQKIERDLEATRSSASQRPLPPITRRAASQHFLRRWWTFREYSPPVWMEIFAIISGGAALDRETEEFWHRLGYAVVQGYGLTETTSLISLNHPFHTSRGSIGKVLPGRELRLADDGEILVRGSGVASGYWNGRELVPVAGDEGWYGTGDLGRARCGRQSVFQGTQEGSHRHPGGNERLSGGFGGRAACAERSARCVVVGIERGGNAEPCAVLILHERGRGCDEKQARSSGGASANQNLAEYQKMRQWFVWPEDDFPRTIDWQAAAQRDSRCGRLAEASKAGAPRSALPAHSAELVARVTGRTAPKSRSGR